MSVSSLKQLAYPAYEARLARLIKGKPQPKHIAIMADGNRRWAREAGFTDISHGHRQGAKKIGEMISWCRDTDIEVVTHLSHNDVGCQVRLVGHLDLLPDDVRQRMVTAAAETEDNTGVIVNVAVGYGGRQEIVDAVQNLVRAEAERGTTAAEMADRVTAESIGEHLYTKGLPDPDLVIRTSGEQRLSGFLLWQAAYSEIWFTDTYWPAFRKVDFLRALRDYSQRSRRFGK